MMGIIFNTDNNTYTLTVKRSVLAYMIKAGLWLAYKEDLKVKRDIAGLTVIVRRVSWV